MAWLIVILLISALVGRLRGGRLRNLAGAHARAWWLLLVGLVMQAVATYLPSEQSRLAVWMLLGSYLPILVMVWINRNEPGMWIASPQTGLGQVLEVLPPIRDSVMLISVAVEGLDRALYLNEHRLFLPQFESASNRP